MRPTLKHWLIVGVMLVSSFSAMLWTSSTEKAGSPVVRPSAGPVWRTPGTAGQEHASRSRIVASAPPVGVPTRSPAHHKLVTANNVGRRGFLASKVWAASPGVRRLRQCENSGSYRSKPWHHYRGAYQFERSTWNSVGGSGDPAQASKSEQDYRAYLLFLRDGRSPWPVCGRYL